MQIPSINKRLALLFLQPTHTSTFLSQGLYRTQASQQPATPIGGILTNGISNMIEYDSLALVQQTITPFPLTLVPDTILHVSTEKKGVFVP